MRKKVIVAVLTLLVLAFQAFPCKIYFQPDKLIVEKGKKVEITVFVKLEHRRCPIDIEETKIDVENVKIVAGPDWSKEGRMLYAGKLRIILTGEQGKIRVYRECDKKGLSEGILEIAAR